MYMCLFIDILHVLIYRYMCIYIWICVYTYEYAHAIRRHQRFNKHLHT